MVGKRIVAVCGFLFLVANSPGGQEEAQDQAAREAENGEIVFKRYPRQSLQAGEHGAVGFEVELFQDGRLRSCTVTESSGFPRLDSETCELIVRYARFRDAEARVDGRGRLPGVVRWELPEGLTKATPPPAGVRSEMTVAAAEERLVCRRTLQVGSTVRRSKMCLTPSDWAKAYDNARKVTEDMRERKGPTL